MDLPRFDCRAHRYLEHELIFLELDAHPVALAATR